MLDSVGSFFETTLGNVPLAVLTIALLATPTVIYLIYRLSVPVASHGKARKGAPATAQWVCPRCRSVNDLQSSRCYHCDFRVDDAGEDLLVIDSITAKPIVLPPPVVERPAVAVGPGPVPGPAQAPVAFAIPSGPSAAAPVAVPPSAPVPAAVAPANAAAASLPAAEVQISRPPAGPPPGMAIGTVVGARRPFDTVPSPAPVAATAAVPMTLASTAVAEPEPEPEPVAVAVAEPEPEPESVAVAVAEPEPVAVAVAEPEPEPEPVAVAVAEPEPEPEPAVVAAAVRPQLERHEPTGVRLAPRLIVATPMPDPTSEPDEPPPAG